MKIKPLFLLLVLFTACKVAFIASYDPIIEQISTKLQKDFNLFYIKLSRALTNTDSTDQNIAHFQDYYDNMNADLAVLLSRSMYLDKKGQPIRNQIRNIDSTLHILQTQHQKGLPDGDDRHDIRNAINSSFGAIIRLQEELKPKE